MRGTPYEGLWVRPLVDYKQAELLIAGLDALERDWAPSEEANWGFALAAVRAELRAGRTVIELRAVNRNVDEPIPFPLQRALANPNFGGDAA